MQTSAQPAGAVQLTEVQYLRLSLAQARLELAQTRATLAQLRGEGFVQAALADHAKALATCGLRPDAKYSIDDDTFVVTEAAERS